MIYVKVSYSDGGGFYDVQEFKKFPLTLGRDPKNNLYLPHDTVSLNHAKIEKDAEGNVLLSDLESSNGILFAGEKIGTLIIEEGTRVHLGAVDLVFSFNAFNEVPTQGFEHESIKTVKAKEKLQFPWVAFAVFLTTFFIASMSFYLQFAGKKSELLKQVSSGVFVYLLVFFVLWGLLCFLSKIIAGRFRPALVFENTAALFLVNVVFSLFSLTFCWWLWLGVVSRYQGSALLFAAAFFIFRSIYKNNERKRCLFSAASVVVVFSLINWIAGLLHPPFLDEPRLESCHSTTGWYAQRSEEKDSELPLKITRSYEKLLKKLK